MLFITVSTIAILLIAAAVGVVLVCNALQNWTDRNLL